MVYVSALKGQNSKAQGNALGKNIIFLSPEGAAPIMIA